MDLLFRQLTLCLSMQGHLPPGINATRMTISHMFLEVILALEHLVLLIPRANTAGVNTVRMLCTMPQIGVTSRVRLAATDFLTPPSFVLRALGVPVETLEVLEFKPTLQTYQTLNIVVDLTFVITQH